MDTYFCCVCEATKHTDIDCHGDPHDGCTGYWVNEEQYERDMEESYKEQSLEYFNRYIAGDR